MPQQKTARPRRKPAAPKDLSTLTNGVVDALTAAGGADYLLAIARDDPKTFCALLTKVLPLRLDTKHEGGITLTWQDPQPSTEPESKPPRS